MTPYLDDGDVQLHVGDARDVLAELPEKSVHAILSSPPFFGLRDYGVDRQIGLEATPDEWARSLVEVFRACRRVLRDDGTLWVEIGDSYASSGAPRRQGWINEANGVRNTRAIDDAGVTRQPIEGLKQKDIVGAPFLLAFALRADGWYWRGCYVWEKPDAMPESVRDRCTVSHSIVLQFAKSRAYFFDRDAIREPFSDYSSGGDGGSYGANADDTRPPTGGPRGSERYVRNRGGVPDGQVTLDGEEPEVEVVGPDGRTALHLEAQHNSEQHRDGARWPSLEGRSPRSVWRITTEANSFGLCPACRHYWPDKAPASHCGVPVVAHFAVWPHKLVERIVACSTSEAGVCGDCGAPRVRQTSEELVVDHAYVGSRTIRKDGGDDGDHGSWGKGDRVTGSYDVTTTGWEPTCECAAPTVPATVLDPFGGSGTTARQARRMGRRCVLVELSPDYAEIAAHRLNQLALPLAADA